MRLGLLAFPVVSGWLAWGNGRSALLGWNPQNSTNASAFHTPGDVPSKVLPHGVPLKDGQTYTPKPSPQEPSEPLRWSWWEAPSPSPPLEPPVAEELAWGWWSISLLVEWAAGRIFSTRLQDGKASTSGGWATYLVDRTGLWCFGNYWPLVAWASLAMFGVGLLAGLAWSVKILRQYLCCCCGRRADPAGHGPGRPPQVHAAPSVEVAQGYLDPEFAGPFFKERFEVVV